MDEQERGRGRRERELYWHEFCTRNVDPKCVIDFPFEDAGGLNLSRDPDNRLLERLYCFEDHEDDMHLAVGGRRRRVILKVHALLKWRERGEKLFLRASKVTAAKLIYANWNAQTNRYEQEMGSDGLKLVPVSERLQFSWQDAYREGRYDEIEWEWRKQDSMPLREHQDAGSVYALVRATIEIGERIFPRAATVESMQGFNSFYRPWNETTGLHQTNKMLRGGQEVEYEVLTFLLLPV